MRRFFLALLLFPLVCWADVQPEYWVGTPLYYSKYVPKVAPCSYDIDTATGACGWAKYPDQAVAGTTTLSVEAVKKVYTIRLTTEITCIDGECKTRYGEYRGTHLGAGVSYWSIPVGFYLHQLNGQVVAIKDGNGPLAKQFPIRDVVVTDPVGDVPDGEYVAVGSSEQGYSVYCTSWGECSYQGRETSYASLKGTIPAVLTHACDDYLCYTDDGRAAGLNPKSKG